MRQLLLLPTLVLLALFVGCGEQQADLSTPKEHKSGNFVFDYPKNWEVTDDVVSPEFQYLIVETPGDAIAILQSYPVSESTDLKTFAQSFAENAAAEMPYGKMENSKFKNLPATAGFQQVSESFEINLLGESVPHNRLFGAKTIGDREVFLILQVATEDYSKVEAGFHLIQNSLQSITTTE